jgi:PKD repeat protein
MKKISTYFKLLSIMCLFIWSQNADAQCAPNFIYTINGGNVTFTSTSTNVSSVTTTYYWSFGNGNTANGMNMITTATTYTANGIYSVSLFVVSTAPTCSNQVTYTIAITGVTTPTCNINASFNATPGSNGNVSFVSTSTGVMPGAYYNWNFGDMTSGSGMSTNHTYTASGNYNVVLTAVNPTTVPNCLDSVMMPVTVTINTCVANSSFSLSPTSTPQFWNAFPLGSNITAASWSWGDGSTSNTLYTSHTYSAAGNYSICLTVTVSCGANSTSCGVYNIYRSTTNTNGIVHVNVINPATVGIKNYANESLEYILAPNPNNGEFQLSMKGLGDGSVKVHIYSFDGKLVYESNSDAANGSLIKSIKLENAANGIYFLKVDSDAKTSTQKLVISNK